ncbi:MAG: ATP-binding protein [Steroidobacteraceae bacterium]
MNHGVRDSAAAPAYTFDIAPPKAASLAESLRAFGYDLPTALADLVDNSITAGAKRVWIDFHWNGSDSAIAVTDDGRGMSVEQLVAAMRLGSQNPREKREPHDLGRFGLGLKTASFSQCRRVTVRTRAGASELSTRCWDLDHLAKVDDWQLLHSADAAAERHLDRLDKLPRGTAVLWQRLDRLTDRSNADSEKDQQVFLQHAEKARRHLGMVFHRLMSGRNAVEIRLNDRLIAPWDPFLEDEPATQILAATKLSLRGAVVKVHPFVLPHQSKISKAIHEAAAGIRGWNAHQGFYIYRNLRLLVAGDWLGFGWAKEEHYKLARIRVDTPNSLDHDWAIDVTKSRALPPPPLRDELRRIAERTRSDAKRVYSHRGAKLTQKADQDRILLWEPMARHDKTFYRINREHPLLKRVVATSNDRAALQALLRLIEETIPFPHITISGSERPDTLPGPFDHAAEKQIREVMEQAFLSLVESGYGPREAANRLRTIWPFELFPALLAAMAERLQPHV